MKKKSLISIFQIGVCFFMTLLVIVIGSLWLNAEISDLRIQKEDIRQTYLSNRKKIIENEVKHVLDYIGHKKEELAKRAKKEVQKRTEEAYRIAHYIYEQNKDKENLTEIKRLIHDALYAVSWHDGKGYYFAEDMEGIEKVNRNNPELEGQNIIDLKDSNGKYIVKEILAVARSEKKEGFCSYHWNKPEYPDKLVPKISYVKYFEPLDWVLGNGMYIVDEELRIQQEILNRIDKISFSSDRYIFIGTWDGTVLSGPGKGRNMWDVTDANGVRIVQELIESAKKGGGFVHYVMPKLKGQRADPKISYSAPVLEWQWYIGTGIYVDAIENDIIRQQDAFNKSVQKVIIQTAFVLVLFLLISYLLIWLFSKKIKNDFDLFVEFFIKSADKQLIIPPEKVSFREFQSLALSANQMVTNRQNAVVAKEKSEDRFRRILENIKDVYFESGLDGSISYCSPSVLELLGYHQDELIGKNTAILYNNGNDRQYLIESLQKNGSVRDFDLSLKKKTGEIFDASVNADFAYDNEGQPFELRGTIRDVTIANRTKEQLQRSKKMEAIGLMAGGVAHDLNNILSGVIAYPELLLQTLPTGSELRKPIEAIHESGQIAATVVADLLTVARGAATIREVVNLNKLIQEYADSPECHNLRGLYPEVIIQSQFDAAHATISCSPVHIKKCLMNLVLNAAEAIVDHGTIEVSTNNQSINEASGLEQEMEVGDYVVLQIQDTGPGISETDLKHIFEPFYTKKIMGRSGTGLGLAVVWNTMEDHKGKVLVESSETGTCFQLYFPLSHKKEALQSEKSKTVHHSHNNEHILVVDDEPQLRDIASQLLQSFGYHVDSVSSGELALKFVRENPVDLIVLDMLMEPGMNGRQTYEEISKLYPGQKAIIASGFSMSDDVKAAIRLGATGFIKKPYSGVQLSQVVKEALN